MTTVKWAYILSVDICKTIKHRQDVPMWCCSRCTGYTWTQGHEWLGLGLTLTSFLHNKQHDCTDGFPMCKFSDTSKHLNMWQYSFRNYRWNIQKPCPPRGNGEKMHHIYSSRNCRSAELNLSCAEVLSDTFQFCSTWWMTCRFKNDLLNIKSKRQYYSGVCNSLTTPKLLYVSVPCQEGSMDSLYEAVQNSSDAPPQPVPSRASSRPCSRTVSRSGSPAVLLDDNSKWRGSGRSVSMVRWTQHILTVCCMDCDGPPDCTYVMKSWL